MQGSRDQSTWTDLLVTELSQETYCNLQLHEFTIEESKTEGLYRYIKIIFVDSYDLGAGLHFFDIVVQGTDDVFG